MCARVPSSTARRRRAVGGGTSAEAESARSEEAGGALEKLAEEASGFDEYWIDGSARVKRSKHRGHSTRPTRTGTGTGNAAREPDASAVGVAVGVAAGVAADSRESPVAAPGVLVA